MSVDDEFKQVLANAISEKVSKEDLLDYIDKNFTYKDNSIIRSCFYFLLITFLILMLVFFALTICSMHNHCHSILNISPYLPFIHLEDSYCLVSMNSFLMDIFKPPSDCSICRDIKSIEKVQKISKSVFETKYAYSGLPVVIIDAMNDWKATSSFSFDFFRNMYLSDDIIMKNVSCQFFPYRTLFNNLSDVFNMNINRAMLIEGFDPWYIGWGNCDDRIGEILRKYYKSPYFLPDYSESSTTDWIFMGSPGFGAHMHVDNVVNPSWQAQVTGSTGLYSLHLNVIGNVYLICK